MATPPPNDTGTTGQKGAMTSTLGGAQAKVSGPEAEAAKAEYLAKYKELRNKEEADMAATRGKWKDKFLCQGNISALVGSTHDKTKSRDWLCKIDDQLRYRESRYSTAATNLRIFVEGAEVTPSLEGSVSWSIQSTGGMNSASFTLNNSEDNFIITPANVCAGVKDISGWRIFVDKNKQAISDYAVAGWNSDESAKYQIYKRKWNKVFRDPKNPEIDETGMWLYPLTPHTCIFNKHDCVRIFVRLAHVTGAWGVENKKKDFTDLWVPAFSGFIDGYDFDEDAVTGKKTVHVKCYDYRGLLDRMRVRMEGNPTGSETKPGEIKAGAGIATFMAEKISCTPTQFKCIDDATKKIALLDAIPQDRYIALLNQYKASNILKELFTNAFLTAVRVEESQNGRMGLQQAQPVAVVNSGTLNGAAKEIVCALVTFNNEVVTTKFTNRTSIDFSVDGSSGTEFRLVQSTKRLESDEQAIKELQAALSPGGKLRVYADSVNKILIDTTLSSVTVANQNAVKKTLSEKITELNKATSWLPPAAAASSLVGSTAVSATSPEQQLEEARDNVNKDKTAFAKAAGANISMYIKQIYNKLTSEAQSSLQQTTATGGLVGTVASVNAASGSFSGVTGNDWANMLAASSYGAQFDAIIAKAISWYSKASSIMTSASGARMMTAMKAAVDTLNTAVRDALRRLEQFKQIVAKVEEQAGNRLDLKKEQRGYDLYKKVLDARTSNDANQGYQKAVVNGKIVTITAENKDQMSKADLLTVDASFATKMSGMYADLVRQLERDAHPLAGKTFEGSVEWLTLMNIPTWKGYQFYLKDYAEQGKGQTLQDWNKLALFGAVARPLSYQEVTEIGRGTVSEIDDFLGAFSPVQPFVHMLLPENGTGAMSIVQQHLQSNVANQSAFRYATRLSLLNEICGILDYQFYVSPFGDLIFEFPHYNALPSDFGVIFRGAYTIAAELRTCRISSEVGEMNTAWVLEGFEADKGLEGVTDNANVSNLIKKYVIVAPMLARRVGAKVKYIKIDMPGVGAALGEVKESGKNQPSVRQLIAYAYLAIQREIGHSESVDVEHNYRPYLLPNRPMWVVHRQRIGLSKTVSYTVDVYKGAGTAKCELGYIRSMFRDGTFRNVAGGWRNTVDYAGLYAGYSPKVKFGASGTAEKVPDGAATIKELAKNFNTDYGWALGAKQNGVFCVPAVGTRNVVIDPTGQGNLMTRYPAHVAQPKPDSNSPPSESTGTGLHMIGDPIADMENKYKDKKTLEMEAFLKKKPPAGPKTWSKRKWSTIDSIMVHGTGSVMSDKWWTYDSWKSINAHYIIRLNGETRTINAPDLMVWHGHKLSIRSIGIEMEGNFAGLMNSSRGPIFWKGGSKTPTDPTPAQVSSLKNLIYLLSGLIAGNGSKLKYIYAHRQSAGSRESDPGQRIWHETVLEIQDRLGLQRTTEVTTDMAYTKDGGGPGNPIPREWDPSAQTTFFASRSAKAEYVKKYNNGLQAQITQLEQQLAVWQNPKLDPATRKAMSQSFTRQISTLKSQMRDPY